MINRKSCRRLKDWLRRSNRDKKVDKDVAEWKDKLELAAGGTVDFDNMGKPEMTPDEIREFGKQNKLRRVSFPPKF